MIRVTIVEDNETIRYGLRVFLDESDEFECVGEYSSCEEMLEEFSDKKTDVVLMDIDLPGISGIEGIKEINKIVMNQKIIILTIYSESENLFEALAAGAFGYVEKKTPSYQMLKIIREVHSGKSNMNTYIARKVLTYFENFSSSTSDGNNVLENNEYKILKSLTSGNSPKAIADYYQLTTESVFDNFYKVYEKLHMQFDLKKDSII